jgi:hypothetical protein
MVHSSSATSARWSLSLAPATRAVVVAPALIATLSLCSLARAQEPAASPALESAAPQPSAQPLPPAAPAETAPPTTNPTAAVREAAPAPAPAPAPAAPTSEERPLRLTRVHEGLYLRFTSGPSFVTLQGHNRLGRSASITDSGAGGSIAIGGALVPGLVLAGTLQGTAFAAEFEGGPFTDATVSSNGKRRAASNKAFGGYGMVGMLVDWYPKPTGNWHAGFATGLGAVVLTNAADDSDLGGLNFSGSLFGGYDWSLGRNWALGLQLTASGGTTAKMYEEVNSDDARDTGYRLTPFSVGVQASLLYF